MQQPKRTYTTDAPFSRTVREIIPLRYPWGHVGYMPQVVPLEACRQYLSSGTFSVPLEAWPLYASSGTEQVPLEACRRYASSSVPLEA